MTAYRTPNTVHATWCYEVSDLLRADARLMPSSMGLRRWLLAFLPSVLVSAPLAVTVPARAIVPALAVMVLSLVAVYAFAMRRTRRRAAQRAATFPQRGEQRLELTEERFALADDFGSSSRGWELVSSWEETADDFYVWIEGERYHLIPKRALGPDGVLAARHLLTERARAGMPPPESVDWRVGLMLTGFTLAVASVVEAVARALG